MLLGITNDAHLFFSTNLRTLPFSLSVTAAINLLALASPTFLINCRWNKPNATAGSSVVPDFEITMMPKGSLFKLRSRLVM
ncbi:MAG: hypothetical protein MJ233_02185 [Mycoplasmoidaceae bacterium]|nr:hypothetical protein [Mycoplasmoidaceae bacterium]